MTAKLTLEEAQRRRCCRICGKRIEKVDSERPADWQKNFKTQVYPTTITMNFGEEFAHTKCLSDAAVNETCDTIPGLHDCWPIKKTIRQDCEFDVPLDQFAVHFGCAARDTIQLELQTDGLIYLYDRREIRGFGEAKTMWATVPFATFAAEWPWFVKHLKALTAGEKTKCPEPEREEQ